MRHGNAIISLAIFAAVLSGCSIETKPTDSDKRSDVSDRTGPSDEEAQDPSKGRVGLRMPKKGKKPYAQLYVYLEKNDCMVDGGGVMPRPEPYPVDEVDDENGETVEVKHSAYGLRTEAEEGSDDGEYYGHEEHGEDREDEGFDCGANMVEQKFAFEEGAIVSIGDLVPGDYSIYVNLEDAEGNVIEEGYGWAYVAPGVVTSAAVELYPTTGNGQLDLEILRAGDRKASGSGSSFDGCGPSAYIGEDGEVHHAACAAAL
jgi:hypothetical protein